jgi:hypothetical protein
MQTSLTMSCSLEGDRQIPVVTVQPTQKARIWRHLHLSAVQVSLASKRQAIRET